MSLKKYYIGIDPGANGATFLLDEDSKIVNYQDMPTKVIPTVKKGKKAEKTIVDNIQFFSSLRAMVQALQITGYESITIGVEDVHQVELAAAQANHTFGRNIETCALSAKIICLDFPNVFGRVIQPKQWQDLVWIYNDRSEETLNPGKNTHDAKKVSKAAIKRLFQDGDFFGPRGGFLDGRGDACLIAYALIKEKEEYIFDPLLPFKD